MKLAIVVPCYHWVSTTFFSNFVMLEGLGTCTLSITNGVYLQMAMDDLLANVKADSAWERMLIIEQDMILPSDTLKRHTSYKEPIVGGMYFRHAPPHEPIIAEMRNGKLENYDPQSIERMLRNPRLHKVGGIGFGCTSIRRDVFEAWPKGQPMFITPSGPDGRTLLSHDYHFCLEAAKLGFSAYVDSGLQCKHLTEDGTSALHWMAAVNTGYMQEPIKKEIMGVQRH